MIAYEISPDKHENFCANEILNKIAAKCGSFPLFYISTCAVLRSIKKKIETVKDMRSYFKVKYTLVGYIECFVAQGIISLDEQAVLFNAVASKDTRAVSLDNNNI